MRRGVATAFSRQAYRLERELPKILIGAQARLDSERAAQVVWQFAMKEAQFGHAVVAAYRTGRYGPAASLVRTLFEDATLLAWLSVPDGAVDQRARVHRVLLDYYRGAKAKGASLPDDAEALARSITGRPSRKPPSWEDRVKQLDADESTKPDGVPFWSSHVDHVSLLNQYVHAELGGAVAFTTAETQELLGFMALVYGHQYMTLSLVSIVRMSDQNALSDRAQAAFARIHKSEQVELERLVRGSDARTLDGRNASG